MSKKHILYIGNLRNGGNGQDRVGVFENAGFTVSGFNIRDYKDKGSRLIRSLGGRLHVGPSIVKMNRELSRIARVERYDLVFVDKGTWIYPETLESLKENSNAKLAIHFTPDPQFYSNKSRHFYRGLDIYDLLITTKTYELPNYKDHSNSEVMYLHQGFGKRINHQPDTRSQAYADDVGFIGHYEKHYATCIKAASQVAGTSVRGSGWKRFSEKNEWCRQVFKGDSIYGDEYCAALKGAKIGLGLLSKIARDNTTTRTFEIPGSGIFLLAERTEQHLELFEEGLEAEFFDEISEMQDKIGFYLKNIQAREKIANRGLERCLNSGYSAESQFSRIIEWINKHS